MRYAITLLVLASSLPAHADPVYSGRLAVGASLGVGGMADRGGELDCTNCDQQPATLGFDLHIGMVVAPRLAVMLEVQANGQLIAADDTGTMTTATLVQSAVLGAAQLWLTPRLWLKGGLGFANLQLDFDDELGFVASEPISNGVAALAGIGYEVMAMPGFAVDLQGRLLVGSYRGIDEQISSATVGVGINWY